MNIFGDIERLVADLWPFRVPIAVALLAIVAIVVFIGYRRGWHRVLRAHPLATTSVVVVLLVVAIPSAWLLGSPLFIRTELNEAPPVAAAPAEGTTVSATGGVLLEGEFVGADSFHFGEGNAEIIQTASGEYVVSLTDFSVLNGPDLFVYVSPDPETWTPDAVNLGALKATDGSFSYEIPAGVEPADIGSVVIWCRAFAVLFASATLQPAEA